LIKRGGNLSPLQTARGEAVTWREDVEVREVRKGVEKITTLFFSFFSFVFP
jgi:hypothetical protein